MEVKKAEERHAKRFGANIPHDCLAGPRHVIGRGEEGFPEALMDIPDPPKRLFVLGDPDALQEGLAVVGARKATPYGLAAARAFAQMAAERGIVIISGGALGCDSAAHRAALDAGGKTVVFLGGGCDRLYPRRNLALFQEVVERGGALVSEQEWGFPPLQYTFRARNRLIAGLAKATLIVEAGLPSGTFSTADEALAANREVLAVPGSISSPTSRGANRLIWQGATPVVDRESFEDTLVGLFGCMRIQDARTRRPKAKDPIVAALDANPMRIEEMLAQGLGRHPGYDPLSWLMVRLEELVQAGIIARYPDGRYGPSRL